jgi:hypothetical protein
VGTRGGHPLDALGHVLHRVEHGAELLDVDGFDQMVIEPVLQ